MSAIDGRTGPQLAALAHNALYVLCEFNCTRHDEYFMSLIETRARTRRDVPIVNEINWWPGGKTMLSTHHLIDGVCVCLKYNDDMFEVEHLVVCFVFIRSTNQSGCFSLVPSLQLLLLLCSHNLFVSAHEPPASGVDLADDALIIKTNIQLAHCWRSHDRDPKTPHTSRHRGLRTRKKRFCEIADVAVCQIAL